MYPMKVTSALGLLAGWLWLGSGFMWAEVDQVALGDLDAGGRFAMNFSIVLPYFGFSLIVVLVLILSLRRRPETILPVLLALVVAFVFSIHVVGSNEYFAALPDLESRTIQAMMMLIASLVPALIGVLGRHQVDESVGPQAR